MKHTPEPWIIDRDSHVYSESERKPAPFTDSDGVEHPDYMSGLVALPYGAGDGSKEGNARRIARCVNALKGISDPAAFIRKVRDAVEWLEVAINCMPTSTREQEEQKKCAVAALEAVFDAMGGDE